jgi:hypothetical protein
MTTKPSPLSAKLAAALDEIRKLKNKIAVLTSRPLAIKPKSRPKIDLPPSLRAQHDALTSPAERAAFRRKHWKQLTISNQ